MRVDSLSLHFVTLSLRSVGKRCSAENNPHRRFAPFAQPTRPPSHDPQPQRLPFAAGCGRATMLALFPPLLITNPTHPTLQALLSASLRLRSLPNAQAQSPSPTTRKCRAEYSPALAHLNPTTKAKNKPLNSARQSLHSLHSLHFVTRSFRSVGKRCSAEKNPHRRCSPLRSVCVASLTTQLRPTPAKALIRRRLRKSNHAGSLSAFAHNQSDTHNSTGAALRFAPFAQPAQRPIPPDHPAQPDHPQMQCRVQPCTCSPQPDHQSHKQTAQQRPPIAPFASLRYAFIPLSR